ncbi:MAG TPA: hypothetical protein VJ045_06900 [Hyphomicrobiaceae bacterium]|nr:hypothetical protein [Hyphomicrobiaceae bacterium]
MLMHRAAWVGLAAAALLSANAAAADSFSTSATSPSPWPQSGTVTGNFASADAETSYYFAVDLKAGDLATQISFLGRPDADKMLELGLLNGTGRQIASHYILNGLDANQEQARVLPVDSGGRYLIRVTMKGPETTSFKVALAGASFPRREPAAADAASFLAPAALPADGVITGSFPGGDRQYTYYYYATTLKAGDLLSQISFSGRADADKYLELALLSPNGREVKSHYIMSSIEANQEATRSFPVDKSGPYVLRVAVKGAEGTAFRVELGGKSLAMAD